MDSPDDHVAATVAHQDAPDRPSPTAAFAAATDLASTVMRQVTPDQFGLPTPCDEMSVAELCEHLVMVVRRVIRAGQGVPVSDWPVDAADVAEGEWARALADAAEEAAAVWADVDPDRPTELPWGVFPAGDALDVYTNEVTVHTWDLATATGVRVEWDPGVLAVADAAIRAQLPLADRTPIWEAVRSQLPPDVPWDDPFGPAVEVSADAPPIDQLVAWNGRSPAS